METRHGAHGFMLVELLVVVGIILILTVLIFPVSSRMFDRYQTMGCASIMRQLAVAHLNYVAENQQRIITGTFQGSVPGVENTTWESKLAPYFPAKEKDVRYGKQWACPASYSWYPKLYPTELQNGKAGPTIGLNPAVGLPTTARSFTSLASIQRPSQIILFADQGPRIGNDYTNPWNRSGQDPDVSFIHDNRTRMNVIFLDGHVEALNKDETKFIRNQVSYPWTEVPQTWVTN